MKKTVAATVAVVIAVAGTGCAGNLELATRLAATTSPSSLPLVVACWEKAFEDASFKGSYVATVDFTVEARTSRVTDAKVTSITADPPSKDEQSFRACLEAGLDKSALPTYATPESPGFQVASDLRVKGFRLAFSDASSVSRAASAARNPNMLVGPRADRCQGLYSHEPPRVATMLYEEIAEGDARASYLKRGDQDEYARQLQKTYDAQMELRERLSADLVAPGVPDANRLRIKKALVESDATVKKTGALIGCTPAALH